MQTFSIYEGLSAVQSASVAGNAVTSLLTTPNVHRRGVKICNTDTSRYLWVTETNSASAPTVSAATCTHIVAPRETITLSAGGSVYFYCKYDDGSASTGVVNAKELY